MENQFSIKAAFSWGWQTFKQHWALVIGLLVAAMVVPTIVSYAFEEIGKTIGSPAIYNLIVTILLYVLNILISIGLIVAVLKFYDQAKPEFTDLFTRTKYLWKYFLGGIAAFFYIGWPVIVAMIISVILTAIGAGSGILAGGRTGDFNIESALSVGGPFVIAAVIVFIAGFIYTVYLSLKYMFWNYSLVDRELGPVDSLRRSGEITVNQRGQLLLFLLAAAGLNILGAIALLVGLLVTIPVTWLAMAYVYRQLSPSDQTMTTENAAIPQEPQPVQQEPAEPTKTEQAAEVPAEQPSEQLTSAEPETQVQQDDSTEDKPEQTTTV